MPTKFVLDFSTAFGGTLVQIQCPHCSDIYEIDKNKIKEGVTDCWKCHRLYSQKASLTGVPRFVRDAVHRVKG